MKTRDQIIHLLSERGQVQPVLIANEIGITTQAVHYQLRKLLTAGVVRKCGTSPRTRYELAPDFQESVVERMFHFCKE